MKVGDVEEVVGSDIMPDIIRYAESDYFQRKISSFLERHECDFSDNISEACKSGDKEFEEMKVEYMEIFQKYKKLIESLLEEFAEETARSVSEISAACRDCVDDKFCPLFEENENKWFVELLLSWLDFDNFMQKIHVIKMKAKDTGSRQRK